MGRERDDLLREAQEAVRVACKSLVDAAHGLRHLAELLVEATEAPRAGKDR